MEQPVTPNIAPNSRKCLTCLKVVDRIRTGVRAGSQWVYFDKSGSRWHGNTCPKCYNKKQASAFSIKYKKPRKERKEDLLGQSTPLNTPKMRSCRRCKNMTHNYYSCANCLAMDAYQERQRTDASSFGDVYGVTP